MMVFGRQVSVLLYADDIVLLAESAADLQAMLDCAQRYAAQWRFRFNSTAGKSDVVIIDPSPSPVPPPVFRLGPSVLNIASEYRYLGVEFGNPFSWRVYLERVCDKARIRMREVAYSVAGRAPLQIAASVKLFKTLVRPLLEHAAAIWGCDAEAASGLESMDKIQTDFSKAILHMQQQVSPEYLLRELHLERMAERVDNAVLSLFGNLCKMGDARLAGHVFRERCRQVDAGLAAKSWCAHAKQLLLRDAGFRPVWRHRRPLPNWKLRVQEACSSHYAAVSMQEIASRSMSRLDVFDHLGPSESGDLLRTSLRHRGARIRFRLRAGALPLFWNVAASDRELEDIEPENRICLLCKASEVENAKHFLCSCDKFEKERYQCLALISQAIGSASAPRLRAAMQTTEGCLTLFLGDSLQRELQPDVRQKVDSIICDFLRVAWKKRKPLWRASPRGQTLETAALTSLMFSLRAMCSSVL